MQIIPDGSVTSPAGYSAGAAACGLKESGLLDLTIVVSVRDCSCAGLFTRNQVRAAPVILCQHTMAANRTRIRAVVANAGVANACTGPRGLQDARTMQRLTSQVVPCKPDEVLVLSTGVIGVPLDMRKISGGIEDAAMRLSHEAGAAAALAIMTTDTEPKHTALLLHQQQSTLTIGGMAKGAGMIHPDLATMLAILTCDASIHPDLLENALRFAVRQSFNRITVDGDTSTNDTILLLANGASGVRIDTPSELATFTEGLTIVCQRLAKAIVRDAEGATKFIAVLVTGARTEEDAAQVARTIATSPLVKTAFAGGDPNWGRILAAAGRSGILLDPDLLELRIGPLDHPDFLLVQAGSFTEYDVSTAASIFAQPEFALQLDIGMGKASQSVYTCDLTKEYVTINAEYRT